jgi:cysteine-rich repeat protein
LVCGQNGFCESPQGVGGSGASTGSGGFGAFGGNAGSAGSGAFGGFGAFGGSAGSAGSGGGAGVCGDGNQDPGEECDESGNTSYCDANCTYAECGDGTPNTAAGEECDTTSNSSTCDYDCTLATCGDSYANSSANEQCDDGGESSTCNANCTVSKCGDGIKNVAAGEECDDFGTTNGDGCSSTCKVEVATVGEDCSSAVALNLGPNTINWSASVNNYLLTTPSCSSSSTTGPDVVFSYTAASSGVLSFDISKPTSTRWVATTSAGTCGSGVTQLSCVSDYSLSKMTTSINVTAGTTYYLYLADTTSGANPLSNPVSINVALVTAPTASGEDCATAIPLSLGANSINWTASVKNYMPLSPSCANSYNTVGPDVVMSYTPTTSGTRSWTINKPASTRWVALVDDGTCGVGLTSPLVCTSDFSATSMGGSAYMYSGTTYYFYVADTDSGSSLLSNPFTLTLN